MTKESHHQAAVGAVTGRKVIAAPDLMHPTMQAEIARQVSIILALRDHEEGSVEIPKEQRRARLVVFPGKRAN